MIEVIHTDLIFIHDFASLNKSPIISFPKVQMALGNIVNGLSHQSVVV